MSNQGRTRRLRPAATPLAALWAALLIVFALVAPVLAAEGPTKLTDPGVSPRTGSPTTTITFTVNYRNHEGSDPEYVNVVIDGTPHRMTPDGGGTNWKSGEGSHWSSTLAAGTHTVSFTAMSRDKFSDTAAGGTVTITIPATPTPTPTPTPKPTPDPTPTPTPRPDPTPTPRPDPTPTPRPDPTPDPTPPAGADGTGGAGTGTGGTGGDGTTGGSTGGGTTGGTGTGGTGTGGDGTDSLNPSAAPGTGSGGIGGTGGPGGDGTDPTGIGAGGTGNAGGDSGSGPDAGGSGTGPGGAIGPDGGNPDHAYPDRATPDGAVTGPTSATSGDSTSTSGGQTVAGGPGWGAFSSALEALGIHRPPTLTVLPMLVGTSVAMTMAFAFAIFGKKRRDETPPAPDEVLHANAARGHGSVPGSEVVNGVVRAAAYPAPIDLEAGVPRWRRASLLEARKADPTRSVASSQHMSFENGAVGPVDGHERRTIRYAVVRLLDAPDELRSAEIGQLDRGDEVQLIERSGAYWLVLCPDGRQGWLHKMTLGDVVTDSAPTTFGRDIDDDVLGAFLAARAQA